MHLQFTTALPIILSLLVTQTTAQWKQTCDYAANPWDTISYKRSGVCGATSGIYYCGESGVTVTHKQPQIVLRAGKGAAAVRVSCGKGSVAYTCRAGGQRRFKQHPCMDGVQKVEIKADVF
ncbi:hypothetical protein Vi05172_g8369 [Venturia inaequalis]|nr:hypothetical protein Vi05172_g8369 [Venturia inaequalis]